VLLGHLQNHLVDEELVALQRQCIQAYPRLINYGEGFDEIIDANGNGPNGNGLPPESDEKMQEHYKKMYASQSQVADIVTELRAYKNSTDPGDQDLFACMIHGLFDEYNCFPEYPIDALATTAVLFGGLINFHLLSRIALQTGLAMILEALQSSTPEGPMYKFGLQALLQCKDRLQEWPSFCDRLLRIQGLESTEIYPKVQEVVRRQQEEVNGNGENGTVMTNGGNIDDFLAPEPANPAFTCLHVDPSPRPDLYEDPDEEVQDKVLFVLNNVSERNLKDKLKDLKMALEEKHHQWFASYLVEERAKMQPNFQSLYFDMLEAINDSMLWAEVLRETFISCFRLLNAESTLSNSMEKTHLKNLGAWLGSITLARDKPIKYRNISFVDLLLEGHETQRLVIVIPFTCKVLIQAAKSTVLKPPNPWIMEIIKLLMELYHFEDLKLNLKFEIEVLCKDLNLDYTTIEPTNKIHARKMLMQDAFSLNDLVPDGMEGFNELSSLARSRPLNDRFSPNAMAAVLGDFSTQLQFPPSNPSPFSTQQVRQILIQAAQQAVFEIISPVVERSVTIAAIATASLVAKDFALEGDEMRFREAAHQEVKALAGSLALVTCKEPLRVSIMNNIRVLARDLPDSLPEGLIIMFVNDNLDMICGLVENAAESEAQTEIDMHIEEHLRERRLFKNNNPSEPFKDPIISPWAFYIPEPYKQSLGGLNREQLAVYEEFGRQPRALTLHNTNASQDTGRQIPDVLDQFPSMPNLSTPAEAPAVPRQPMQQSSRMQPLPTPQQQPIQHQLNGFMDNQSVADRITDLLMDLLHVCREAPEEHASELGPQSPAKTMFDQILNTIASRSPEQQEAVCQVIASKVSSIIYSETKRRLETEVFVRLLQKLCTISVSTSKAVINWLVQLDDDRAFNSGTTVCLLAEGILDIRTIDLQIARSLREKRVIAIEFFASLVDELLLPDPPLAFRAEFSQSIGALADWILEDPDFDAGKQLLSKLLSQSNPETEEPTKTDQLEYMFTEWVKLVESDASEKLVAAFIDQIHQYGILRNKEETMSFLRICINLAVARYELEFVRPYGKGNLENAYMSTDALAKLIVALVTYQGEASDAVKESKATALEGLLSLVILEMNHHHRDRAENFNQKVFFRLFSTILCILHKSEPALAGFENRMFIVFGTAVKAMQPRYFPGFAYAWLALVAHRMLMAELMRPGYEEVRLQWVYSNA
jgi:CCR4-NOT transcription complex subunit 1